jgi:hypothetical protein
MLITYKDESGSPKALYAVISFNVSDMTYIDMSAKPQSLPKNVSDLHVFDDREGPPRAAPE